MMMIWVGFKLRKAQLLDFQEQETKLRNSLIVAMQEWQKLVRDIKFTWKEGFSEDLKFQF
jgi:hypothetical protein